MLTREQHDAYISNGGNSCPYCGNEQIEGGSVEMESTTAWQKVWCSGCHKEWLDIYTLLTIEEIKED